MDCTMTVDLDPFLKPYSERVRALFHELRGFVREAAPDAVGLVYDAYNAFGINFSSSDELADGYCTVVAYSTHVNLGFNRGAELTDPKGLLLGKGKTWRHLQVRAMPDLDREGAGALIAEARALSLSARPEERAQKSYPALLFKKEYRKKRRPS